MADGWAVQLEVMMVDTTVASWGEMLADYLVGKLDETMVEMKVAEMVGLWVVWMAGWTAVHWANTTVARRD
jgi:hypothetical protein